MRLRHALVPYIYTMAWRNTLTALPLITPMYYSHPEAAEAYQCPQQYWFGSQLVAAPFTRPAESDTGLARQILWLPPGEWFDFFTGEQVTARLAGGLRRPGRYPALCPGRGNRAAGRPQGWGGTANPQTLDLYIFPGRDGRFDLYEDDGETLAYTTGQIRPDRLWLHWGSRALRFTISPAAGDPSVDPC